MDLSVINTTDERPVAVRLRNAYKRFSVTNVILNGLNMTVSEGTVYGLLGPSGCGKTTLLHCIVGRSELDSGEIQVKAKKKANVGYMPQEIALYNEFSIMETMTYYGRLFGLSAAKIEQRTNELLTFLELPAKTNIVGRLSGGQERRVSFAVALLHDPQLLILDEPTVGVDPVLSASIWERLLQMAAHGNKTVIITTHYIEEARQAHTVSWQPIILVLRHAKKEEETEFWLVVLNQALQPNADLHSIDYIGLMRNGQLLAEESPAQLMLRYNCSNLEHAFLELSRKQHTSTIGQEDENCNIEEYPTPKQKPAMPLQRDSNCSFKRIVAQLMKNFYWMKRNKAIMCFLLLLPVVQCFLFCLCIGRDPHGLKVAVVDEEVENGISGCQQLPSIGCNFSLPLSCRYLHQLQRRTYKLIEYPDIESAKTAVKRNKVWGLVYFSSNYTSSLVERIMLNKDADELSMELSEVNIWQDMSNQYISNLIRRDVLNGYVEFLQTLFFDCGWPPRLANIPLKLGDAIYGNNNPSFSHFTAPAIISLFEFYLPMVFTVGAILMEKMAGLLERSLVAGVTVLEVVLSHMVVQFIVLSMQTTLMMLVLFVLYDNPLKGSLVWILLMLFLTGASGMCYGFMVSVMCDTDTAATFMGLGSFFPLAMLSGMMWPLEGMHWILRSVGWILPITLSTETFRALSARAWTISHPTVYKGFFSSLGWICFFLFVTMLVIRKNNGLRTKK